MAMHTYQEQLFNFNDVGWTLVRQMGNELPPTEALQLVLIKIYKHVK